MTRQLLRFRVYLAFLTLVLALSVAGSAVAVPFTFIQLGDDDGLGYKILNASGGLKGLTGANYPGIRDGQGNKLDGNANLRLDPGEFMPDLDGAGTVASGGFDGFNHRSAAESGGASVAGAGFTLAATGPLTNGSQWTDISIVDTYSAQLPSADWNTGNGGFPDANQAVPNEAFFRFSFFVNKGDIDDTKPLYLSIVFGDYEVIPAQLNLTGASGSLGSSYIPLTPQPANKDGLIQLGHTDALPFSAVFTDCGTQWKGFLEVKFAAPNEPYYAVDFVQLGQTPVGDIPEPATLALLGTGVLGAAGYIRRRRMK